MLMAAVSLPPLREELTLHPGPAAADGSPTWSLQDPVRDRFFRIDWMTFLILAHWDSRDPLEICAAIARETPLEPTPEDVEIVLKFLAESQLLQSFDAQGTHRLVTAERGRRESWLSWLLHHYLSFRIALLRPDRWLTRAAPYVAFFHSRTFLRLTIVALALGSIETLRQWPRFAATFVDMLSWNGLLSYALVLIGVKTMHELGHAFTAKRYGCRVPTMGIAFLVMWPVAYTDVNDTWKLPDKRQRLAVSAAGVLTELAIAAWATLAWSFLPDGALRTAAFLLAAVTWISTVAVNASPFMRFDGYFLLSDGLDIPNLHSRAFALARWRMRELLFALGEEAPEHFPVARRRFLIAFAWLTWGYRFILFLGIAVLVYRHFFKALGIVLFAVEIVWFVAIPIARELREWQQRWPGLRLSRRTRFTAAVLAVLLALCFLPLDFRVSTQGILRPARTMAIYAPEAGFIVTLPKSHGSKIAAGEPLLRISSPELERREAQARVRLGELQAQLAAARLDVSLQKNLLVLDRSIAAVRSQLEGLAREQTRLAPRAAFAGQMMDPPPDLRAGEPVARNEFLGTLIDPAAWEVKTYLEEGDVLRIRRGDSAWFYPETAGMRPYRLKVIGIDRDASRSLPEAMLASTHEGKLAVRLSRDAAYQESLVPEQAIYGVTLAAEESPADAMVHQQRGQVMLHARRQALFRKHFESAAAVLIRELGN